MGISVFYHLIEVFLHVLKHKVQGIVLPYHLLQLDYVRMGQLFQGLRRRKGEGSLSKMLGFEELSPDIP